MIDRFKRFRVEGSDADCWPWTGSTYRNGYGSFGVNGRTQRAHRVAYELFLGAIPDGLHVDHTCHNASACIGGVSCQHRRCVNPAHLEAVPKVVNTLRGEGPPAVHARQTSCSRGHPFNESNTYVCMQKGRPRRRCRRCDYDNHRRYAAQRKETAR